MVTAPPGSASFEAEDIARLSRPSLRLAFEPGPAAPPLEDVAAALGRSRPELVTVAGQLPAARGERLLRLSQRPITDLERERSRTRLVAGLFWLLVYELRPDLWDRLARLEEISPDLLQALDCQGRLVVEVAAGTGRLSCFLAASASLLVAIEPVPSLRARLRQRLQGRACVVAAVGHRLPLADGAADLVVSCASFGPDFPIGGEPVVAELERVVRIGGRVAVVGPEQPGWWDERGYELHSFAPPEPVAQPDLEAFFGPLHPPSELALKTL